MLPGVSVQESVVADGEGDKGCVIVVVKVEVVVKDCVEVNRVAMDKMVEVDETEQPVSRIASMKRQLASFIIEEFLFTNQPL